MYVYGNNNKIPERGRGVYGNVHKSALFSKGEINCHSQIKKLLFYSVIKLTSKVCIQSMRETFFSFYPASRKCIDGSRRLNHMFQLLPSRLWEVYRWKQTSKSYIQLLPTRLWEVYRWKQTSKSYVLVTSSPPPGSVQMEVDA